MPPSSIRALVTPGAALAVTPGLAKYLDLLRDAGRPQPSAGSYPELAKTRNDVDGFPEVTGSILVSATKSSSNLADAWFPAWRTGSGGRDDKRDAADGRSAAPWLSPGCNQATVAGPRAALSVTSSKRPAIVRKPSLFRIR